MVRVTVGGNVIIMAMILSSSTPPLLKDMFPVINMALENSMACRVFRNIKLGSSHSDHLMTSIDVSLPSFPNSSQQNALRHGTCTGDSDAGPGHQQRGHPVLSVTKTVETFTDRELSVSSIEGYV